jgi:hypothetical protein
MSKWLGPVFVFGVVGGLAVAVGFSWKQAILLAVLAAYVERGLDTAVIKPRYTFEPYYVSIIPDWKQILADYRIVKQTGEDWEKFTTWSEGKALPLVWYSVLRNDKDGVLIYRGAEWGFLAGYHWSYEVTKRKPHPFSIHAIDPEGFPNGIEFFVKQNSDVLELGLDVDSDWWQRASANCPEPLEAREGLYGTKRIVLANLPLQEFDLYWNETDYKSKNVDRTWKLVRQSREKHGWKEIEKDKGFTLYWQPNSIRNKYFEVQHHSLS